MTEQKYPARIWKERNVYYVQFLDLKNGFTYGNTLKEAKEMAGDVLSTLLASYIEHDEPIAKPSHKTGKDIYLIKPVLVECKLEKMRATKIGGGMTKIMGNL